MKKFLTSAIAAALVATSVGAFVACGDKDEGGNKDAELAQKGLATVIQLTESIPEETPQSYTVLGQTKVEGKTYNVKWSVSSEFPSYETYVSVGEKDPDTKKVTINITKATEVVEYTLTATVTVGKASKSEDFQHKIPASQASVGEVEAMIDFTGKTNRTVFTDDQQIWTANGITLTNDKASSVTKISQGDSDYHVRLYQNSNVKIEYPGMVKLVFHSDNTYSYFDQLLTTLNAVNLGTVTSDADNATATLVLTSPTDVIEFEATKQMRLTALDIVANENGATDEDKVNGAKAALDIANKSYTAIGTYDLPAEKNGATVTWALKAGTTSDYVEIEGGNKLKVNSMPQAETNVELTATIKSNAAEDTKDFTITLVPLGLENDGSLEHPYTAAEAWQVANLLTATSTEEIYVKGFVVLPGTYSGTQYNNFDNMYIADSYDPAQTYSYANYTNGEYGGIFYIFRPKAEGDYLTKNGLRAGDEVTFKGNLANYNGTSPQLANGVCVARVEAFRTDAEKIEDALNELEDTLTVTTTGANDLPTSTVTGVTFTWSTEDTTYTVTDNKLNVAELPAAPATVTLTVSAACGTATAQIKTVTVTVKASAGYGTLQNPLSVTETLAITADECKANNNVTKQVVTATGVIASVAAANNGFYNYTLRDAADATKTIIIYTKPENVRDSVIAPAQNDVVVVSGYIKNYNGTIEFASNSGTYVYFESNTRGTSTITLTNNNANATVTGIPETETNGATVTFTVVALAGKTVTAVKVNGNAIAPTETNGNTYTFSVAGNMDVTVDSKADNDPDPVTLYTLDTTTKNGTNNSYTGNCDIEMDGVTWNFEGNAKVDTTPGKAWRLGGKSSNTVDANRCLTAKTAITGTVTEMAIEFGGNTVTVNSVTLKVYKVDPTVAGTEATYTKTVTFTASKTITVKPADGEDWTGCYYQLVFNLTSTSTSNQYVEIKTISFTGFASTAATTSETETQTLSLPEAIVNED